MAVGLHAIAGGWAAARVSLLGAALGLGILLPFWLLRSLGGGDWKLVGGLGAFFGVHRLIDVLIATLLVNAATAIVLIVTKRRLWRTLKNMGRLIAAFFRLHLPASDLTIDNPHASKVPFGVAAAIAVVIYVIWVNIHGWRAF